MLEDFSPIENLIESFFKLYFEGMPIRGDTIGRDEFRNGYRSILVDTCYANDIEKYETAIRVKDYPIVIVETYSNPEDATVGHESWVRACKEKEFYFNDIFTGETYLFSN